MAPPRAAAVSAACLLLNAISCAVVDAQAVPDVRPWTHGNSVSNGPKEGRNNVISPRMDFDQWTPLGRGDPLKNDPTFDYLPPVLDKVHYWKLSSPAAANRAPHHSSTPPSTHAVHYNRRFFLTDFSRKEPSPSVYAQYTQHKRPQMAVTVGGGGGAGYYYPRPKTPLPMLTPPPYQWPAPAAGSTTVQPADMSPPFPDAGDAVAESKQPPAVRAPPPTHLQSSAAAVAAAATATAAEVRPVLSQSVIKALLDSEVDRTTVTTPATTAAATAGTPGTSVPPRPTADPLFAHYKQPAAPADGRPPTFHIIQGHSKVKTYGLVSKSDDLAAARPTSQDHNHLGNGPDEPSRRKRGDPQQYAPYPFPATAAIESQNPSRVPETELYRRTAQRFGRERG